MKKIITVILAVALLAALAMPAVADAFTLYASKDGVKVYAKKSTGADVYRRLSKGERVLIEKQSGKWYAILVEDPSGDGQTLGWIQAKYLSSTKPSKQKKEKKKKAPRPTTSPQKEIDRVLSTMQNVEPYEAEVVTKTENGTVALRWQPTTGGRLIRQIVNGKRVKVLAEGDGWSQVSDPESGYTGFMSANYLVPLAEVARNEEDEPEVVEAPEAIEEPEAVEATEAVEAAEADEAPEAGAGLAVEPVAVTWDVNHLPDGTYPVSFDRGDVASLASGIYMNAVHIWSLDLYAADAVEVLAVGDTLVAEGAAHPVNSVEKSEDTVTVNGGLGPEDGYVLIREDEGFYRVDGYDDLPTYTEVGVTTLVLDPDAVYNDSADIEQDPVTARGADIVAAMQGAAYASFYADNTTVTIEGGKVVRIDRTYVP